MPIEHENFEKILAEHSFFKGIESRYLSSLVERATMINFNAGEFIFHQGEKAQQFYFLLEGKVALEVATLVHGSLTIQTIGRNEVLGWSWLLSPYTWHFDARAMEVTTAVTFDGKWLREKCQEDHELGYEFMKRINDILVQRLQATRLQLLDVYGVHF
jgi:CRP-like cAMP-binding protein